MPIRKMLDVSTAHITSADAKLLGEYSSKGNSPGKALIAYPFEYGWTVSTSGLLDGAADRRGKIADMRREGFSEHFINLMKHAADKGAVLVRLDADAEYEPGLPTFDWEHGDEMSSEATSPAP